MRWNATSWFVASAETATTAKTESGSWIAQAVDKIQAAQDSGFEISKEDIEKWGYEF